MKKYGFTLAEVLITLGIIGVVAALVMPALIANYQKMALKTQFKKTYNMFLNAVRLTQTNMGGNINCYYWATTADRQYGTSSGCAAKCSATNAYGTCTSWTCQDDSPLVNNYNGMRDECTAFDNELFFKTLKVAKHCKNNALANGCVSEKFQGLDQVAANLDPDTEADPGAAWSVSNIRNKYPAFVLADGTIIIRYSALGGLPTYVFDINGHKGPNKWGYDIFNLQISGNLQDGIQFVTGRTQTADKGGTPTTKMIQEMHK